MNSDEDCVQSVCDEREQFMICGVFFYCVDHMVVNSLGIIPVQIAITRAHNNHNYPDTSDWPRGDRYILNPYRVPPQPYESLYSSSFPRISTKPELDFTNLYMQYRHLSFSVLQTLSPFMSVIGCLGSDVLNGEDNRGHRASLSTPTLSLGRDIIHEYLYCLARVYRITGIWEVPAHTPNIQHPPPHTSNRASIFALIDLGIQIAIVIVVVVSVLFGIVGFIMWLGDIF